MPFRRLLPMLAGLATVPAAVLAQATAPRDSLLVSPDWLAERLEDQRIVVLQVERDSAAYTEGHIPGARLVDFRGIMAERDGLPNELPPVSRLDSLLEAAGVSTGSRVVIVGEPLPAARLFFTLDFLGMGDQVALLDGGLARWRAQQRPLTTDAPAVTPGHFEPRPRPELLVDATWVEAHLADPLTVVLDARPEAEFHGEVAGDGVVRAGHLPGARSLFWRLALASRDPGALKSAGELTELLADQGAVPGKEIVVYCRVGVQSSYLYFVARTLGYTPRLYDGSFIDWNRRSELPVEAP